MRRLPLVICLVCLAPMGAAHAEEKRPFRFGLETRFSQPASHQSADLDWSVIPNFSYHLTERFRLDAFAGFAYSQEAGLSLRLQPGFRYYLGPGSGRFRYNTGLSVGFTVIDQDAVTKTDPLGNPVTFEPDDDGLWLRAVPLEVEYWGKERWGLIMALDYQTRVGADLGEGDDGFGLAAGFRFKIR